MIKKIIIPVLSLVLTVNLGAQVGINTEKPTSALDVNGSVRASGNLLLGGNDVTPGSAGTAGQFLVSKGEGAAPEWQTVKIVVDDNSDWVLVGSIARVDNQGGMKFEWNETSGAIGYPYSYSLNKLNQTTNIWGSASSPWREFEDFAIELAASEDSLRIVVNIQVLVQAYWKEYNTQEESWMSYAVGIFHEKFNNNGKPSGTALMLATRQGGCNGTGMPGSNYPQQLMTLIQTVEVPPKQDVRLLILATQRNNSLQNYNNTPYLSIGHNLHNALQDETLLRRATMRADIYKKVTRQTSP